MGIIVELNAADPYKEPGSAGEGKAAATGPVGMMAAGWNGAEEDGPTEG